MIAIPLKIYFLFHDSKIIPCKQTPDIILGGLPPSCVINMMKKYYSNFPLNKDKDFACSVLSSDLSSQITKF